MRVGAREGTRRRATGNRVANNDPLPTSAPAAAAPDGRTAIRGLRVGPWARTFRPGVGWVALELWGAGPSAGLAAAYTNRCAVEGLLARGGGCGQTPPGSMESVGMADEARDLLAMRRLQSGEKAALGELYDRHAALLFGVARRILRNGPDAEDVLQEAWVQVWNQCANFDPARGSVVSWLVTIARTRALDRRRRNAARGRVELEAPSADAARDPEDTAARVKLKDALARALVALDPKHRQVLEIAYFEGLSQSQIAARLGAPLGSVKYWARQGLIRLKELVPRDEWV